jgi:hypothetical protein
MCLPDTASIALSLLLQGRFVRASWLFAFISLAILHRVDGFAKDGRDCPRRWVLNASACLKSHRQKYVGSGSCLVETKTRKRSTRSSIASNSGTSFAD